MSEKLEALRDWWERHGSENYATADDWINSLTNVELIGALGWFDSDDST